MAKLTMETTINSKSLASIIEKNGIVEFEGLEYVLTDDAFIDNNSDQEAAYFGYAVKIGDEIDGEGYVPLYKVEWKIINEEAEDGSDACDWNNAANIRKVCTIEVETGNIY